jgi:cystathionine beta-lyase
VDTNLNIPAWIADRRFSDSLKWAGYAKKGILPMWVADMDFRSPDPVIQALRKRADEGVFGYGKESHEATEAVVHWLSGRHGWTIQPEWVVWTPGVVSAINVTCRAFAEPHQGIFTFTPIYPPFLWSPEVSGRRTITSPLKIVDGHYDIDLSAFESSLTADTRVLLLCSPHNPVGRVWNRDQLLQIASICLKRDILICSDEIHCDLILDHRLRHTPTASLSPHIADQTVTFMSPAKTFNLPGLDCGFAIISNPSVRKRFKEAARGIVPHVNVFGYVGCTAAFTAGIPWLDEVLDYLRGNHDLLHAAVNGQMHPLSMAQVEATYLAWIDCRRLASDNPRAFFEKAGVGLMDGAAFGQPGFVRLNFACSREHLSEAIQRMKIAIETCHSQ